MKKERKVLAVAFTEEEFSALNRWLDLELKKLSYYRLYDDYDSLNACQARLRAAMDVFAREREHEEMLRRFREESGLKR